ncbi:hypothetical protein Q5752_001055 [Cryptotrichosporon argae]
MAPKTVLFASAAAAFGAVVVSAQAAPNWEYFPTACASDCAQTIEAAYLCEQEYSDATDIYGCYCTANPSDASTCATCLDSNDAAALGALVTSDITECTTAFSSCFFECSITLCDSTDVACQCSSTYLEEIYNCASCNTANGNTGATQLSDFQALNSSCGAQSYTGAYQDFATVAVASPTGQDAYVAPTLTATGGGDAATGSFAAASGVATGVGSTDSDSDSTTASTTDSDSDADAATATNSATAAAATSATAAAGSSTTSKAASGTTTKASTSTSKASGSASTSGSAATVTVTASSGAREFAAPAGLLLAVVGGVAALL